MLLFLNTVTFEVLCFLYSSNMVDLPDVTLGDVLSTSHSETASRTCQTNSSSNSVLPLPHGKFECVLHVLLLLSIGL